MTWAGWGASSLRLPNLAASNGRYAHATLLYGCVEDGLTLVGHGEWAGIRGEWAWVWLTEESLQSHDEKPHLTTHNARLTGSLGQDLV